MSLETQKKDLRNAKHSRQAAFDFTDEDIRAFYPVFLAKHPDWKKYDDPVIRYKSDIRTPQEWEDLPYPSQLKQQPGKYRELQWFKYLIRIPVVKEPPDPFQKWYPKSPDPVKYFSLEKLKYRQLSLDPSIEVLNTRIRRQKELKIYGWGREMTVSLDFYVGVSLGEDNDIIETRQNDKVGQGAEIMTSSLFDILQSQEDKSFILTTLTLDFNEKHWTAEQLGHLVYMGYVEGLRLTLSNILWNEENITWSIWKQQRRAIIKPDECTSQLLPGERWGKALKVYDTKKPRNEKVYCKTKRGVSAFWKPVLDEFNIAFKDAIVADDGFSLELVKNMDFFNDYFK